MFNQCFHRIRYGFLVLAMPVLTVPVLVQAAPAPSQDFWEYMNDFSDEDGEVLDPVEVDQMLSLKEARSDLPQDDAGAAQKPKLPATESRQTNTSINTRKSSVSSSAMSGVRL